MVWVEEGVARRIEVCDSLHSHDVEEKIRQVEKLLSGLPRKGEIKFTKGADQRANDCGFHAVSNIVRIRIEILKTKKKDLLAGLK